MRRLLHGLGWVAAVGLAALLGMAELVLDRTPRVTAPDVPAAESLRHLRQVLRAHDPRRKRAGTQYEIDATAADLQLLAGHGARLLGAAAEVELGPGRLTLRASAPVAPAWLAHLAGGWLNAELQLGNGDALPTVLGLKLGRLPLPGMLAGPLLRWGLARAADPADGLPPLTDMLQGVQLRGDGARIVYEWRADTPRRVFGQWLAPAQLARLRAYHERLATLTREATGPLQLPALLAPMFALAQQRSAAGSEPAAENRAALLTLALYASGRPLGSVLPAAQQWPRARWRPLLMRDRTDFPQHLLVSAALAAEAGGTLADALGLAKEVSDARYGSGFSFNDLAANRAGARLGMLAVQQPVRVQAALALTDDDRALLPDVSDLPEFMSEADFERRFGGVGQPRYEQLVADIEARVRALPLLR